MNVRKIAALIHLGLTREMASGLGHHVHKGDTLVIVHLSTKTEAARARQILEAYNPRPDVAPARGDIVSTGQSA